MVIGGLTGVHKDMTQYSSTEILSPSASSWQYAASLPSPRYGLRAGNIHNVVYIFGKTKWQTAPLVILTCSGGYYPETDSILSYNVAADKWQEQGGMTVNRRWHQILYMDNVPCPSGPTNSPSSPPTDSSSTPPTDSPSPPTDSSSPPTDSPSSPPPCPSGWSEFEGNCYKYFDDRMKWEDARDFCLSEQVLYYLTNISEMFLTRLIWFPFTLMKKIISWLSSLLDVSPGWGEKDHALAAKTFCGLTGLRWTTLFGRLV